MNCKMVLSLAVLIIISTLNIYGQKPTDEDPYLLWQTTDPLGYSGFIIHPNGNIIANRGTEVFELDGNTGQFIKTFPVFVGIDINTMDVTKDGKILGAGYGNIILYDLANDTVIGGVSETNGEFSFFPDSKRFIARTTNGFGSNLMIYNLETKEKIVFGVNYAVWSVATSHDGKYFATGGTGKEQVGIEEKDFTYLTLWDAITMKPIKQLGKFEGNSEVRSIKFSSDGKYVGFSKYLNDCYVYSLEDMALLKYYNYNNIEYGVIYFCFLDNDLIGLSSGESFSKRNFMIKNLTDDKEIFYRHGKSGLLGYNPIHNSFLVRNEQIESYNLSKILTLVNEPTRPNTISIHYKKGILILNNLNSIAGQINITLSDISGRVIKKLDSSVINSEFKIPILLSSGTYLLHIWDGKQEYSSKFLVSE